MKYILHRIINVSAWFVSGGLLIPAEYTKILLWIINHRVLQMQELPRLLDDAECVDFSLRCSVSRCHCSRCKKTVFTKVQSGHADFVNSR